MPTILSHAVVAVAAGSACFTKNPPPRFLLLSAACSILPDIDFLAFSFGIPYGHFFGHRGFTHSLFFAMCVAIVVVFFFYRNAAALPLLILYFFLITASHGLFDAMTNGGLGVAFFSPFETKRYFLPFRPLKVSPVGLDFFFNRYSLAVLYNEFFWLILPSLAVILIFKLWK